MGHHGRQNQVGEPGALTAVYKLLALLVINQLIPLPMYNQHRTCNMPQHLCIIQPISYQSSQKPAHQALSTLPQ